MSLINQAERLNTANQLKAWNDATISAMNTAKGNYSSIATQRASMQDNVEYSDEDRAEVDKMLESLHNSALELAGVSVAPDVAVSETTVVL